MTDLNAELVLQLRRNARMSISDIATTLEVSRATVRARMAKLEQDGVIIGYTVVLRSDALDMPVRGIMMIGIEGRAAERVTKVLGSIPEVSSIHTTNGRWDLIVELAAATLTDFDTILHRVRLIPGVTSSETNLLLATPYSTRARLVV